MLWRHFVFNGQRIMADFNILFIGIGLCIIGIFAILQELNKIKKLVESNSMVVDSFLAAVAEPVIQYSVEEEFPGNGSNHLAKDFSMD